MNVYDFDKTIYDGDSTADFYIFSLKRHKKIFCLAPSLIGGFIKFYVLKKGSKTEFKQKMYRFLRYCKAEVDVEEFWKQNCKKIKKFYKSTQKPDDVIISASPRFLLEPICRQLGIKNLIASEVDYKTGIYSGINCHGNEKVRRFREKFGDSKIDCFFSDSYSDSPLAEIAEKAFMVSGENVSEWIFKNNN